MIWRYNHPDNKPEPTKWVIVRLTGHNYPFDVCQYVDKDRIWYAASGNDYRNPGIFYPDEAVAQWCEIVFGSTDDPLYAKTHDLSLRLRGVYVND